MADVYKQMAAKLEKTPNGFPATQSGVELRILKKIFSPEEARLALKLRTKPERAKDISKRLKEPEDRLRARLEEMADKGQIAEVVINRTQKYVFMPCVIGIYEMQLKRIDKELSDLFEEYLPHPAIR